MYSMRSDLAKNRAITLSCALHRTIRLSRSFPTGIVYVNAHLWTCNNIIARPGARDNKIWPHWLCCSRSARGGKRSILEGLRSHLLADRCTRDQLRPPWQENKGTAFSPFFMRNFFSIYIIYSNLFGSKQRDCNIIERKFRIADQPKPVPLFYIAVYGDQVKIRAQILGPSCIPLVPRLQVPTSEFPPSTILRFSVLSKNPFCKQKFVFEAKIAYTQLYAEPQHFA
jgi:hypothetical protein